jgi:23S rRNA pseudouridine1911/1915/1917 synthase
VASVDFLVADTSGGTRLDRVVAEHDAVGSRAIAESLIAAGAVLVDGVARPKSHRLVGGEVVTVELPDAAIELIPAAIDIPVLYEDDDLLVVDKPAGLVVHPGGGTAATPTLVHALVARGIAGGPDDRPGIVHRLDRDTSGLVVVARGAEVHAQLSELIRRREVERRYLALVRGAPRSRTGKIDAPIGRDRMDRMRRSLDTPTPREAVTWFELRETLPDHALLDVRLETGRTHQIRVHLEAIGLPVSGDPVYGIRGDLGLERQFLHAHALRFAHPRTGAEVAVESSLPDDLAGALARARG